MSEPLARRDPILADACAKPGVTVSLAPPMARFSLRARAASALEAALGTPVPTTIGQTQGGVACLGPDEWLMRAPAGTALPQFSEHMAFATDISERSVCIAVEGPRAADVIMSGCPLDLDRFAVGRATRTVFETVEIVLIREREDLFHLEVWRSFAPWMWEAVTLAASD